MEGEIGVYGDGERTKKQKEGGCCLVGKRERRIDNYVRYVGRKMEEGLGEVESMRRGEEKRGTGGKVPRTIAPCIRDRRRGCGSRGCGASCLEESARP